MISDEENEAELLENGEVFIEDVPSWVAEDAEMEKQERQAVHEERRQRGIAAKRVRINPALVAFGLRDETRQQLNSARRNKAI